MDERCFKSPSLRDLPAVQGYFALIKPRKQTRPSVPYSLNKALLFPGEKKTTKVMSQCYIAGTILIFPLSSAATNVGITANGLRENEGES